MKRFKRRAALLILPISMVVALLSSCVGIDEKISVNTDGTGTVDLSYRVSKMVADLGAPTGTSKPVPLPVTASDFQNMVQSVQGLSLLSWSSSETPQDTNIKAQVRFSSVSALGKALAGDNSQNITLSTGGGSTIFREDIYPGNPQGIDPETLKVLQGVFQGYALDFSLTAPAPIKSVSVGTIGKDGRTAIYQTDVVTVVQSKEPVVWQVTW